MADVGQGGIGDPYDIKAPPDPKDGDNGVIIVGRGPM